MMSIKTYWQNYINGQWVDGGAARLTVENPSTGEALAEIASANAEDIDRAVVAARACHQSRVLTQDRPVRRGRKVRAIGDWLLANRQRIAEILTLESGKPLSEAFIEVDAAARYFEYYGSQAETLEGRSIPLGDNYFDFTTYEPFGVTAHIVPWNFPLDVMSRSLAPALAAGNTCVVKTPELTPLSCTLIAEATEAAGFPPGAVNMLCGIGHEAGAALSRHQDIDLMIFTGSVATGINVATAAARNVVPCVLELGGKSAAIVYQDADIDNVAEQVRWGLFYHCGQICSALSRVLVHESIQDQVVEAASAQARALSIGPGMDDRDMGSMMSFGQRDRAAGLVETAKIEGAKIAAGGTAPDLNGAFYTPTVITGVNIDMQIAQTEVFGPVLSVIPFKTEDEAISVANNSRYGLVGGVFTRDLSRAMRAAQRIEAGQIFINEWFIGGAETPFGGYKESGYGREKGRQALLNYVQTKNIGIKI